MKTFTHAQIYQLQRAMTVYFMREVKGMKWDEIAKSTYNSIKTCYNLRDYAEKALSRLHGFDHHGSY
jgi:hypothetical protein